MNLRIIPLSGAAAVALLAAAPGHAQDARATAIAVMKRDFHAKGIAEHRLAAFES